MIENLKIVGKSISSSDSDMTTGTYSIPESNISEFISGSNYNNEAAFYNQSSYGAHYTWQVATAGTGHLCTSQGQIASSSICPKGWSMPKGGSDGGEFQILYNAYNRIRSAMYQRPGPDFVYAGYVDYSSGTLISQGSDGNVWSSNCNGNNYAYNVDLGGFQPNDYDVRTWGLSVRCIAR